MFQWSMYYLSFTPLWFSILFLNFMNVIEGAQDKKIEIISLVAIPLFFIISFIIMRCELRQKVTGSTMYSSLMKASEEKLITAEFLATFIIPLYAFDFTTWKGMSLFAFFFFVFGYLCVRHNYFCTNIMLDILGYRIYDCIVVDAYNHEFEMKIISKRNLKQCLNEPIYVKGLNNDYSLECKKN